MIDWRNNRFEMIGVKHEVNSENAGNHIEVTAVRFCDIFVARSKLVSLNEDKISK